MNIIDNHNLLTSAQKQMLQDKANIAFKLGRYKSLNNILEKLNVDVFVEQGVRTMPMDFFIDAEESLYHHARRHWDEPMPLFPDFDPDIEMEMIKNEEKPISETEISLERRLSETLMEDCHSSALKKVNTWAQRIATTKIRGLYDMTNNSITLFPEEMQEEYNGTMTDELLFSTLAHETMHAYFNRNSRKRFPYAMFVEEPLAEFGMLLHYYETQNPNYLWCLQDVAEKSCFYRYGAILMLQHRRGDITLRDYLKDYKISLPKYEMPIVFPTTAGAHIALPKAKAPKEIVFGNQSISPVWHNFINPPKYFWDENTKTLGLDGDWSCILDNTTFFNKQRLIMHRLHKTAEYLYLSPNLRLYWHDYLYPINEFINASTAKQLPDGGRLYRRQPGKQKP